MTTLKKLASIAIMASAGVLASASIAAATDWCPEQGGHSSDNSVGQAGLIPINALNNVNVSPNLGCALDQTAPDLTVQSLIGVVPIGVAANHLLEHTNLNVLSNGNINTETYDNSCTSNQGSSQSGNNSHGSVGAGSSWSDHHTANGAGSDNIAGDASGGLTGPLGVLGGTGVGL